jgi:RNA polymerase sigma factor (sigma-70 family)
LKLTLPNELDISSRLVEGCLKADRKSQELLYKQFFGFAMAICLRYTKTKDEALEVLNDGFLRVFKNLHKYDVERPFKIWLKRIIINAAIDYYRAQNKHYFHQDIYTAYSTAYAVTNSESNLHYNDLLVAVKTLPNNYQITFNMFVIEGYSHVEIAETLKISVGTSKSNLFRAREILRKILSKENLDEKII